MEENSLQKETPKEVKKTKFQSPVPIIIKIRNLIFGKRRPDIFTLVTFYMNLVIWLSFLVWNLISYFSITNRSLIAQQKGIPVERIIERRGAELSFEPGEFLNRLQTFHAISIILWGIVFIGLVMLYRKRKQFVYLTMVPILLFVMMNIFYLSFQYFNEDTTAYDKIALLIFLVSCGIHAYLMKNERTGGSINFFGVDEDE